MIDAIDFDIQMVADCSSVYYFLNTDVTCTSAAILQTALWFMERWYVVRCNQANGMPADCQIMVKMVLNFQRYP